MDKEPKQHVELINDNIKEFDKQIKQSKQEKLEEAALLNCESITHPYCDREKSTFIKGAKWQEQRMYSEEDMKKAFIAGGNSFIEEDDAYGTAYKNYMKQWFEQFKNK